MTVEALQTICVLQGETFQATGQIQEDNGTPVDIAGMDIFCQLKTLKGALVHAFDIIFVNEAQGQFLLMPTETFLWPLGSGSFMDFAVKKGEQLRYTYRVQINVIETITR